MMSGHQSLTPLIPRNRFWFNWGLGVLLFLRAPLWTPNMQPRLGINLLDENGPTAVCKAQDRLSPDTKNLFHQRRMKTGVFMLVLCIRWVSVCLLGIIWQPIKNTPHWKRALLCPFTVREIVKSWKSLVQDQCGRLLLGQALITQWLAHGQIPMKEMDDIASWGTLEGLRAAGFIANQYRYILII